MTVSSVLPGVQRTTSFAGWHISVLWGDHHRTNKVPLLATKTTNPKKNRNKAIVSLAGKHVPEALEVRERDLDAADVDHGLVETHHEAVGLVLKGLDERVQLHRSRQPAPALVDGAVCQRPGTMYSTRAEKANNSRNSARKMKRRAKGRGGTLRQHGSGEKTCFFFVNKQSGFWGAKKAPDQVCALSFRLIGFFSPLTSDFDDCNSSAICPVKPPLRGRRRHKQPYKADPRRRSSVPTHAPGLGVDDLDALRGVSPQRAALLFPVE